MNPRYYVNFLQVQWEDLSLGEAQKWKRFRPAMEEELELFVKMVAGLSVIISGSVWQAFCPERFRAWFSTVCRVLIVRARIKQASDLLVFCPHQTLFSPANFRTQTSSGLEYLSCLTWERFLAWKVVRFCSPTQQETTCYRNLPPTFVWGQQKQLITLCSWHHEVRNAHHTWYIERLT